MSGYPFTGPTPLYNNIPPRPQDYQPSNFEIQNIQTSGLNAEVTTTVDNNFSIGQQVSFHIPSSFGMIQLDNQTAYILSMSASDTFVVDINILGYDSFIFDADAITPAQVNAVGDRNTETQDLTIVGAFKNISR